MTEKRFIFRTALKFYWSRLRLLTKLLCLTNLYILGYLFWYNCTPELSTFGTLVKVFSMSLAEKYFYADVLTIVQSFLDNRSRYVHNDLSTCVTRSTCSTFVYARKNCIIVSFWNISTALRPFPNFVDDEKSIQAILTFLYFPVNYKTISFATK